MAAGGSEFEGVPRHVGNREEGEERDDSERSYVFVEQRESDVSSLEEDLHVVEDPSGDENDGRDINPRVVEGSLGGELMSDRRERSVICESYLQVPGGGGGGGGDGVSAGRMVIGMKEEELCDDLVGNRGFDGSAAGVLDEKGDSCVRFGDNSSSCEEVVEADESHFRESCGDWGKMGESVVEDEEVSVLASPCSLEEKIVEEAAASVAKGEGDVCVEKEGGELQVDDAKKLVVSSAVEVLQKGGVALECQETLGGSGVVVVEVVRPRQESAGVGYVPEGNHGKMEAVEGGEDGKVGAVHVVDTVVAQDEIGDAAKRRSDLESCCSKEEIIEEDEETVPVVTDEISCAELKGRKEVCFHGDSLAEEKDNSSCTFHVSEHEDSSRPKDFSTVHEELQTESGAGAVEVVSSQVPTLNEEYEDEGLKIVDADASKSKKKMDVESSTQLSSYEHPTSQSLRPEPEEIVSEGLSQMKTTVELSPSTFESLEFSINYEQVLGCQLNPDLSLGTSHAKGMQENAGDFFQREKSESELKEEGFVEAPQLHPQHFGKLDANVLAASMDRVGERKDAELVVDKPINVPVEGHENDGKFSSNAESCLLEGEISADNVAVLATSEIDTCHEVTENAVSHKVGPLAREETESIGNIQPSRDDPVKELASSSGKYEESPSAQFHKISEASELNEGTVNLTLSKGDKVGETDGKEAEVIGSFQSPHFDLAKELAGSSGKHEGSPSEKCRVPKASGLDQEKVGGMLLKDVGYLEGDNRVNREATEDDEVQEQKDNHPEVKVPTESSEGNLDGAAEQSLTFESLPAEDKETDTYTNESTVSFEMGMENFSGGERDERVVGRCTEQAKQLPTPHAVGGTAVDAEVSTRLSSQGPGFSREKEMDRNDSSCPIERRELEKEPCLVDSLEPVIKYSGRSVDIVCDVLPHVSEQSFSEVKISHVLSTDGHPHEDMETEKPSSTVLSSDNHPHEDVDTEKPCSDVLSTDSHPHKDKETEKPSSAILSTDSHLPENLETESSMNVTDSRESSAAFALSNVESAKSMGSSFVEDQQTGQCCFESQQAEDRHGNLDAHEQNKPDVIEDGMYFTPRATMRTFNNYANLEPVGNSEERVCVDLREITLPVPIDDSTRGFKDVNPKTNEGKCSPLPEDCISDAKRELVLDGVPQNLVVHQDQSLEKETGKDTVSKEDSPIEGINDDGVAHSGQEIPDSPGKGSRFYIVRLRRNQDDILDSKIELAQLEVQEKTQRRDTIRKRIQKQKDICDELWKNVEDMRKDERAAHQSATVKLQEIRSIREKADMIELVNSIDDTDDRMNALKHRMQHETIPLKEEKQLLHKMKELKQKRGDLSSKLASQSEMEKIFDQKDLIQDHLKNSMSEFDSLKKASSQTEVNSKSAKKKYDGQYLILRSLQDQHKAADDLRQAAYTHLRSLRKELNEKNVHFYTYKSDARAATAIAFSGDKKALRSHCCNQIERFMELWNKNSEFRSQYVQTNQLSTIRRFGTLDGRSLGPDEKPVAPPYYPKASGAGALPPPRRDAAKAVERKQDAKDESLVSGGADKPLVIVEKAVKQDKRIKPLKTNSENATTTALTEEPERGEGERDKPKAKEEERRSMADELARKEEEQEEVRRREHAEAELKEKIRFEQIAKAREAEERKRRKLEKVKVIAEMRARREAERREKKREKKERLKEKKAISTAEIETGADEAAESTSTSPPKSTEIRQTKVSRALPALAKQQQQQHGKVKPLPPQLRNRCKKSMQIWMWALLSAVVLCILLFLGNRASFGVFDSLGF